MAIERQTAYKIWIRQIGESKYTKQEGWNPNYIEVNGKKVSRVNVLATVVGKYLSDDNNYGALTLDDGTDTIRSKAFGPDVKHIKRVNKGGIIRFIGKVKEYNDEIYLAPEATKTITDPNWITLWRKELGYLEPVKLKETEEKEKEHETLAESIREYKEKTEEKPIIEIIKDLDKGNGANIDEVIEKSELDEAIAKKRIIDLLSDGEIFEPKKGILKVLD